MSILETIQLILNTITIPVALLTVLLLIRQTRQLDQTLRSQVYQGLIDNSLKIDQLMIEHPEYRKYVYDYEKVPVDDCDLDMLWGILDFALDVVDNVKAQEGFIPKPYLPGWRAFVKLVQEQPAARHYLEKKYGFWYEGTLHHPQATMSDEGHKGERPGNGEMSLASRVIRNKRFRRGMNSSPFVTSYLSPKITTRRSRIGGFGMFAREAIKQGEIVFVKGGHIVRRDRLFYSEQISSYLPIGQGLFIGATTQAEEGGIKLYVNHSCEPNCGMRGEISFVAMRDIVEGEELTFDYAMVDDEEYEFECCRLRLKTDPLYV